MDTEPAEKSQLGPGWWIAILFFTLGRKILSHWLLEPVAMGGATLLAFAMIYLADRPKIPWTRFVPATCLLAVLYPVLLYGALSVACDLKAGALLYGLSIAGFLLSTYYAMTWMQGEARNQQRGWLIASLVIGVAAGLLFQFFHESICRDLL